MTPRVFLCAPSALNSAQRSISDQWHERLFQLGFDVDLLRPQDYQRDPWAGLLPRIGSADGVLILGLGRPFVSDGAWRRGSGQMLGRATGSTTPWLHVEAGLALGAGLPVLVVPESGVCEGVFAPEAWTGPLRGTAAEEPDAGVVHEWAGEVTGRATQKVSAT